MTSSAKNGPSALSASEGALLGAAAMDHARKASLTTLLGFSLGMIGDRIFRDAPALLLLIFMTNYLAVPPAMAGVAIFVPKLIIMFVDPLVGMLSDRLRTPWGRRKPLMFVGALLASASIVMFFHVPRFDASITQAAYMSAAVLIGFTGYSFYSVPYLVMASEIADTDQERRKVMSWRVMLMAIGLSISAYAGGFVQAVGGGVRGYETMSWVYGGICLVTMMITVFAARETRSPASESNPLSLIGQFRLVGGNKRYLQLLLVGFLQKVAEGVGYGSFAYFCIYVVDQPLSGIGLVVLASTAGQVLAQPLWLAASRRWSPASIYTVSVLGWCLNLVLWLAMKGQSPLWLIPLGLQAGAVAGGFLMVTLGMLSNTMADDAATSGQNREGVYGGVWLASEKLAFALGALIVGVLLALFGFKEGAQGEQVVQPAIAVLGIAITYCGVNMLLYVLSIAAVWRLPRRSAHATEAAQ